MHGRPASEVLGRRATEVFPWIRESGIGTGRLAFEVTETTAVRDMIAAREWMRRLRAGVSIAAEHSRPMAPH